MSRPLLSLFALLSAAGLAAADEPPVAVASGAASASNELAVAKEALRDGLWATARASAEKAGDGDESRRVRLESWADEGKWSEVAFAVTNTWAAEKSPTLDYYRAVVRGDYDAAARILKSGGSPEGVAQARLYEADARVRAGQTNEARVIWREICALTNVSWRALFDAAKGLGDPASLRRAMDAAETPSERRRVKAALARALLSDAKTEAEGAKLAKELAHDSPDTPGAQEAFVEMARVACEAERWQEARALYVEAKEIWPTAARRGDVQYNLGLALQNLDDAANALAAFESAEAYSTNAAERADAGVRQGDLLMALGRFVEATNRYHRVAAGYPGTKAAKDIGEALKIWELEAEGRRLYGGNNYRLARDKFREVEQRDSSRASRMKFFQALCFYGEGDDAEAARTAESLYESCADARVRADVGLWLAKFRYNRCEWKAARERFLAVVGAPGVSAKTSAEALYWAAKAAFAESDYETAGTLARRVAEEFPTSRQRIAADLLQGEILSEQAKFDEAIVVFERVVAANDATEEERAHAIGLMADAQFVMGADNPARYEKALESYRKILFDGARSPSERLVVSFKIARVLEKMKRTQDAEEQYFKGVVLAYRSERLRRVPLNDAARAAFTKAAFRLADEHERRGETKQAINVLEHVATSDCPAAEEARRRQENLRRGEEK